MATNRFATMPVGVQQENPGEPSVTAALEHVLEAGQRVIVDRIDLVRLETVEVFSHAIGAAAFLCFGSVLIGGAWLALMGVLIAVLEPYAGMAVRLTLVAVINAAIGAWFIVRGSARLPGSNSTKEAK